MRTSDNKINLKTQLLARLKNPLQLRIFATGIMIAVGYVAIYLPLSGDIADTDAQLKAQKKRLEAVREVEQLRSQYQRFKHRLPEKTDSNEWLQYVLGGIRSCPVKLTLLDSRPPQDVGPYKAVVLRIELEGRFQDLHSFLCWLETNERFFRVDAVNIAPHRQVSGLLVMQLNVLGVMGS